MSNLNQINTPAATAAETPLPYKQEVGGSSPSAPTICQSLTPPTVQDDPLPNEGSGSQNETLTIPAVGLRYRALVLTGRTMSGPHGTETQTAHEQATFPDIVAADKWLTERVNATGKEGVLLIQREEVLRVYRPLKAKS